MQCFEYWTLIEGMYRAARNVSPNLRFDPYALIDLLDEMDVRTAEDLESLDIQHLTAALDRPAAYPVSRAA
jgi:hypothetical protein